MTKQLVSSPNLWRSALLVTLIVFLIIVMILKQNKNYGEFTNNDMFSSARSTPYTGNLTSPQQFYSLLQNTDSHCRKIVTLGGENCNKQPRAHSEICLDDQLMLPPKNCIIYSLGNDQSYSFEEEILFGTDCEVHIFDPRIDSRQLISQSEDEGDTIHAVGKEDISSDLVPREGLSNIDWGVLSAILDRYQHTKINLLKINLNGAEFEALAALQKMALLSKVQQVILSIHTLHIKKRPYNQWRDILQNYQSLLDGLNDAGFRKVSYKEHSGHMAVVQMDGETRPRQACGTALYVR